MTILVEWLMRLFWGRHTRWITLPVVVICVATVVLLLVQSGAGWGPIIYAR